MPRRVRAPEVPVSQELDVRVRDCRAWCWLPGMLACAKDYGELRIVRVRGGCVTAWSDERGRLERYGHAGLKPVLSDAATAGAIDARMRGVLAKVLVEQSWVGVTDCIYFATISIFGQAWRGALFSCRAASRGVRASECLLWAAAQLGQE